MGYPKWLIDKKRKRDTKMKEIPLVITYHPLLKDFASAIRKHLYILYMSKEVKEVFTSGPLVSFPRARKVGSYLLGLNGTP